MFEQQNGEKADHESAFSTKKNSTTQGYTSSEFSKKESFPANAWLIHGSRFIRSDQRDSRMYLSPHYGDYLFSKTEHDLVSRFQESFRLIEVFDEFAQESLDVRALMTQLIWREDDLRFTMTSLLSKCSDTQISVKDAEYTENLEIRALFKRYKEIQEEIDHLQKKNSHIRQQFRGTGKRSRLIALSHRALLEKAIPERRVILSPWLFEAAIAMIFAPPGVGKTHLCLSVAGTIASGGIIFQNSPWVAPKQRRVLYVDGEMHEAELQARVKKHLSAFETNIPDGFLCYLNGTWQEGFLPDLATIEGQRLIDEVISEQGTQVLFLDNLSTLFRSGRENDADSWRQAQAWLLSLRWRGITVVIVHHAGKGKDDQGRPIQRGTSMREVVMESVLVLSHPNGYLEEMGCFFKIEYTKARSFSGNAAAPFEVKLVDRGNEFVWEDKKLAVKNYDAIVELHHEGVSVAEMSRELGITPQAVRKHIAKAKEKGDIAC